MTSMHATLIYKPAKVLIYRIDFSKYEGNDSMVEKFDKELVSESIKSEPPTPILIAASKDNQGNNALHLAAMYGQYRPWLIAGSALQMQWEIKWYKFVEKSMAKHLRVHYKKNGQTPKQIFTETHKRLVKDGSKWLTKTSESRSLLLCYSLNLFLAILNSQFKEKDFVEKLPRKLVLGLTSLFASIAAMLVSFCAGHFFQLRDKLKYAAFPLHAAACVPICFFALAQLPLYYHLIWAIFTEVPQRSYKQFAS
ncbi:hypothetical protein PTKIN_Ptkin09bG0227300 [Pterospermum kingtungense]